MIYFYARVSTKEQNLERQIVAAKEYGAIDKVFADKQSGKNFERPQYQNLKAIVKTGDEVVIKELDRLGRNKDGIKSEIEWFKSRGVILRILDVPTTLIDFKGQGWISDMVNNILIEVIGAIAEQERKKIKERQIEGVSAMPIVEGKRMSVKTGNYLGRPKNDLKDFEKIYGKQKSGEISVVEACNRLNISRTQWYRLVKEVA